jgi:hypothetical protein
MIVVQTTWRLVLRLAAVAAVAALAGCISGGSGTFRTAYPAAIPAEVSRGWRVAAVQISVPRTLAVSEDHSYVPKADIVWREDPRGDRYNQVQAIMTDAVRDGARGLRGGRPVILQATMTRFHAMTFEAESLNFGGVHDVEFDARIVDARTGQVLVPAVHIEASFPAKTGAEMAMARASGDSQKKQIHRHVAQTIAGWLGAGPDVRATFSSVGG